jgi:PAS domain S-box-containing protein
MTSEAQRDGIILLCDLNGIVQEVQQDELGLTDGHTTGRPFTALVHGDSLKTAFGFVEAVQSGEPAFGYGLFMRSKDDKLLLHINGYALDNQMVITGARSRVVGSQLYHRTLQSHHRQVNSVYATLSAERSASAARESELLDQVARLQADANALSAELAQSYAARTTDPGEARDQSQHIVELTLANGRLQAELSRCSAVADAQHDAESTFAGIFRAGPVGMAVSARSDGRLVEVNAQLERMLDYRRGELTGQPLHKLFAQGSRSILGKVEAHLSVPHTPLEISAKLRMKDGTSRDFLTAFELTELNGELFLVTAVMEAHEHLQTEHDVQENEQIRRELTVQAAALRQEVKLLQDDVRAYKQREQSLAEQSAKLREKIATLEDEVVRREQREKELTSNIAAYQPDARERTLAAQILSLQASRQELTVQVASLQEQAAKAERAAGEHKEREQTLENQVAAVQRLNFRIEALHGAMEEELKKQVADLQHQQAGLEADLARRRQSEDELSHLAANLLESASAHEAELAGFRAPATGR